MEFSIKSGAPEKQKTACIVVGVFESRKLSPTAEQLDKKCGGALSAALQRGDMEGKAGNTLLLSKQPGALAERILLVGLGKEKDFHDKEYLAALRAALCALNKTGAQDAAIALTTLAVKKRSQSWKIRQAVLIASENAYRFDQFKSKKDDSPRKLSKLAFTVDKKNDVSTAEQALSEGQAIAQGVALARDLGNLPANVCTPSYLADQVVTLGNDLGFETTILDRAEMAELGMYSLLSVANGSHEAPKLIVAHYRGAGAKGDPLVLVGKGVTFDSGGISLKPGEGMDEMKYDMCGAASVIGALSACARMQLPINLSVIVPATENMPSGTATRPGDIVRSMSGQSIEILNTDAEGRLILCDALTYAERFSPDAVIDVATLTGACVIALGHVASGLFSNDEGLARDVLAAADESNDRAWRMPLWDDYQDQLKSNFADMANIGGRPAGSVTAACFLSRFAKKFNWAHLDIAGTAWKSGAEKGATGRPVPLLSHFLLSRAGRN
ncbi:MAG TPA: leucyl aminopeptidase [Rhodocyclaceae bacterium]|nr:leucyl aminopeptidase [Rhodocyclaceae bacterium]